MTDQEFLRDPTSEASIEDVVEDAANLEEIPMLDSVSASATVPDFVTKEIVFPSMKELDDAIDKIGGFGLISDEPIDFSILTKNLIPRERIPKEDDSVWTVDTLTLDISRYLSKLDKVAI